MFYLRSDATVRPYRVDISVCQGFFDRLTGALIEGEIPFRKALLFPNCRSVHTVFMRSSIGVVLFDREGTVLDYRRKVPPFRVVRGPDEASGLLELAPDRLDALDVTAGRTTILFSRSVATRAGYPGLSYDG